MEVPPARGVAEQGMVTMEPEGGVRAAPGRIRTVGIAGECPRGGVSGDSIRGGGQAAPALGEGCG